MSDIPDIDDEPTNPDEAVLDESEHVVSLDEDRYLVSPTVIDSETAESIKSTAQEAQIEVGNDGGPPDLSQARDQINSSLQESSNRFSFELIAALEGFDQHQRSETDDVIEAFDDLLRAFALGVGSDDMSVMEVLDILLAESTLYDRHHSHNLSDVLEAYDLTPQDRISAMIDALEHDS